MTIRSAAEPTESLRLDREYGPPQSNFGTCAGVSPPVFCTLLLGSLCCHKAIIDAAVTAL
jgi:hypothetical protein